jgi:hypothetical protein
MKKWIKKLYKLDTPCNEAVKWASQYDSLQAAWDACPRGDWMGWLLDRLEVDKKQKAKLCCMHARLTLPYTHDPHVQHTIEVVEAWVEGKATEQDVQAVVVEARAIEEAAWAAEWAEWAVGAELAPKEAKVAGLRILRQCADNTRIVFPKIEVEN